MNLTGFARMIEPQSHSTTTHAHDIPPRRFNEKAITDVNLLAKKIAQALDVSGYLQSRIPLAIFGCARNPINNRERP